MKRLLLSLLFCPLLLQAQNPILNSTNGRLSITNFAGSSTTNSVGGLPLGTVGGTATGELAVKVLSLGGSAPTGSATSTLQTTGNNSLSSIDTKLVAPTQRTVTASVKTTDGSIALGCRKLTLVFSTDFTGTLLGAAYPSGMSTLTLDAPDRDTISAVAYTVSAGSITSYETR